MKYSRINQNTKTNKMYEIIEKVKYPSNLHTQLIAMFIQPAEAIKFAKMKTNERKKIDKNTSFCFTVSKDNKQVAHYYNNEIL